MRSIDHVRPAIMAGVILLVGAVLPITVPTARAATATKVVVIGGPVDSQTASFEATARMAAAVAREYSSDVTTILSPNATWPVVRSALQGANIVVYVGHGNGFPSRYLSTLQPEYVDGLGLNASAGAGDYNVAYYGESYLAADVRLAPNAVVLLSRLCYASGDSEWGAGRPTVAVARERVDNYAAGFIAAGARAVIADGTGDIGWYIRALFTRHTTIDAIFRAAPDAHGNYATFASARSHGYTAIMDPGGAAPDGDVYYRSMVSIPTLSSDSVVGSARVASAIRTATLSATATAALNVRLGPAVTREAVATVPAGTRFTVTGAIRTDSTGRTWAPVRLASGRAGWIASAYATFSGAARATVAVNLRARPSLTGAVRATVPAGARFTVLRSVADSRSRSWFSVRLADGATGWVASWFSVP